MSGGTACETGKKSRRGTDVPPRLVSHHILRAAEGRARAGLLVVEALSEYLDAPLYSPTQRARRELTVDLTRAEPTSRSGRVCVRSIEPLLEGVSARASSSRTQTHQDISFLAQELGKNTETLMRRRVSARLGAPTIFPAPIPYAFLRQRVPAALPSPLLDASQNFTLIDPLVQNIASLIFGLTAAVQSQTLTSAVALDLIGPQFTEQIPSLVDQLQASPRRRLLDQPYLVGNTTLGQLLTVAGVAERGPADRSPGAHHEHRVDAQLLAHARRRHVGPERAEARRSSGRYRSARS